MPFSRNFNKKPLYANFQKFQLKDLYALCQKFQTKKLLYHLFQKFHLKKAFYIPWFRNTTQNTAKSHPQKIHLKDFYILFYRNSRWKTSIFYKPFPRNSSQKNKTFTLFVFYHVWCYSKEFFNLQLPLSFWF